MQNLFFHKKSKKKKIYIPPILYLGILIIIIILMMLFLKGPKPKTYTAINNHVFLQIPIQLHFDQSHYRNKSILILSESWEKDPPIPAIFIKEISQSLILISIHQDHVWRLLENKKKGLLSAIPALKTPQIIKDKTYAFGPEKIDF